MRQKMHVTSPEASRKYQQEELHQLAASSAQHVGHPVSWYRLINSKLAFTAKSVHHHVSATSCTLHGCNRSRHGQIRDPETSMCVHQHHHQYQHRQADSKPSYGSEGITCLRNAFGFCLKLSHQPLMLQQLFCRGPLLGILVQTSLRCSFTLFPNIG